MTNILILGANGQIARVAIGLFLQRTDAQLTLYLRQARRLKLTGPAGRVRVVEGDVLDMKALETAMPGQPTGRRRHQRNPVPLRDRNGLPQMRRARTGLGSAQKAFAAIRAQAPNDLGEFFQTLAQHRKD